MSSDERDTSFLARWSRQKRAAAAAQNDPTVAPEATAPAAPEPTFDPSTLPDIDTLTAESDIAAFLQKGVPEALQRLAMRRMWALDPTIRDFVEVAENQWDFNAAGGVAGVFEEVAADADLAPWLAQAVASIGPERDRAALPSAEAAAPSVESDPKSDVAKLPQSPSIAVAQPDPPPDDSCAPTHEETARRQTSRRRHGGALPQ